MTDSDGLLGPAQIRQIARELELNPSKRRGQNFVTDANTVRKIVRIAEIAEDDVVLEVGPGIGSLTLGLLSTGARVVAVELEDSLAGKLPRTVESTMPAAKNRLDVIAADAMAVGLPLEQQPNVMVANLPYNVAVPIVLRIIAEQDSVERGLVMVQAEVADRLAASPGSKIYGIPSVKMAWFASVERVGSVSPHVFWPEPRVDSGLVAFERREPPQVNVERAAVFDCIDEAFAHRRKTLRSALASWAGDAERAALILTNAGIDPGKRGEVLSVTDFAHIAESRAQLDAT